jgi:MerR family transcriptional regulator/heat shock protein HspR
MSPGRRQGVFRIGAIAERFGIHPQTLRLYEREGLLRPVRTEGNTRLYDADTIERLEIILTLTRDLGVNLAGVEVILHMKEIGRMQGDVLSSRSPPRRGGDPAAGAGPAQR